MAFAVRRQFAWSLADLMAGRVLPAFAAWHGLESVQAIADLMGRSISWHAQRRAAEIRGFGQWLSHLAVPDRPYIGGVRFESKAVA